MRNKALRVKTLREELQELEEKGFGRMFVIVEPQSGGFKRISISLDPVGTVCKEDNFVVFKGVEENVK